MAVSTRRAIALGLKLGLGLALFAGALLVWYLNSQRFQDSAKARIIAAIEERFPVRAELDSVSVRWWGVRLRLQGLRIHNRGFEEPEPAIDIDRIEVDLTINRLWRPSASLDAVLLESPRIRIVKNPNGRFNLWNMFRRETDLPPKLTAFIRLAIDELAVRDGLILFQDRSFRLESSRGGLRIEMDFAPETQSYRCLLGLKGVDLDAGPFVLSRLDSTMRFGLFENSIEFDAVDLSSDQVAGIASGVIDDLGELVYRFNVNLRVKPTSFERPQFSDFVDEGEFDAVGVFAGRKGDWGFDGQVSSDRLGVKDLLFDDLNAVVRADSRSLEVDPAQARFQGGAVRARGELAWDESDLSAFDVEGSGMRLERLLAPLRLAPFRPKGAASARGRVQWRGLDWDSLAGSGRADLRGEFRFADVAGDAGAARSFPFAGAADFSLDRTRTSFSEGVFDLLSGELGLDGWVGFDGSYDIQLRFQADNGDASLAAAAEAGIPSPEILASWRPEAPGPAAMTGRFQGTGRDFRLSGEASLNGLRLKRIELGAVAASFDLTPQGLRADSVELEGPDQRWSGALAYEFATRDQPPRWSRLSIAGDGDAGRLAELAELRQPLGGRVSGRFEMDEPEPGQFQGRGDFVWDSPAWDQFRIDRAAADIEWGGGQVRIDNLSAAIGEGAVQGEASYEPGPQRFQARLRGGQIPLALLHPLSETLREIELGGAFDFSLQASGSVEQPQVELSATADSLRAGGQEFNRVRLDISHDGATSRDAGFRLEADFLGDRLSARGQVAPQAPYQVQASLQLDRFPLAPALKLLPFETDIELGGEASGSVEIFGPLGDPGAMQANGALSRLRLTMADYEIENQDNVTLVLQGGALSIRPLTMVGPQTELTLSGTLGLTGARPLNVKANGKVNLLLLNSFLTGGATFGQMTLETVLTGTLDDPRIVGQASLERGFLRHPAIPATFFDAKGVFRFTANQIGIDQFSARTPYGILNAEGGVFLEGLTPVRWLVNVFGSGLRLEYPENVFSILDVDLDWINNEDSQLLSGVVYVRSAEYKEQVSVPDLILRYGSGTDLLNPAAPAVDVVLDLEVEGYRTLEIDNNLARVTASGDFKIRGTLQNPVILGSLTVDEGKLFLENNEYEVSRGTIAFNDPRATRPVFDFEAETEVRDFQVSVLLRGPLDNLNVSFRSDPPLANSSIVSLLAVGQTEEEIFGVEGRGQDQVGSLAIYGAGALLSKSLGKRLEAETSRLFGFDKLSIDPFLYGNERDPGARVTLGKRLSKNLSVTYSTDLGNEGQGQIVVVELKLTDWLTVVGTGEQTGAVAVDFKLRKRF